MVFSDTIHSCYMCLYEGLRSYSDYCQCQKEQTIKAMLNLYCIMYSFQMPDSSYEVTAEVIAKLDRTVREDYARALRDEDYC